MFYYIFIIKKKKLLAEKSNYLAEDGLTGWAAAFDRIKQGKISIANEFTLAIFVPQSYKNRWQILAFREPGVKVSPWWLSTLQT